MTYCPKCGKSLSDDAVRCDACGAPLYPEPEPEQKPAEVKDALRKWALDQGQFCLIAKALAVIVMAFYLLVSIVYLVTLITGGVSAGMIFTEVLTKLLSGIALGAIIWLLSDAVLYLQRLYQMKKKECKDK
ncbi:MAG: zinc-ribbon domain-containing protein [Clostridia bacterium]|jgi:hypothetical protein|nr:zinc-ribbon domain-containing protein [Clostridia bacterium]